RPAALRHPDLHPAVIVFKHPDLAYAAN
ncbi:hypothetical protein L195_g064464, partial [Trifolium pratense]